MELDSLEYAIIKLQSSSESSTVGLLFRRAFPVSKRSSPGKLHQMGVRDLGRSTHLSGTLFLSLTHFTQKTDNYRFLLAIDIDLLSRFVVRFEVNFDNSKDSCEGSG